MQVRFIDVGGFNMNWTADLPELNYDNLYKAVKSKGALGSQDIEFTYDENSKKGDIVVGMFRTVGTFEVVEKQYVNSQHVR